MRFISIGYNKIAFNPLMSEKARNKYEERSFQYSLTMFTEPPNYRIVKKDNGEYELVPNHQRSPAQVRKKPPEVQMPKSDRYSYVIVLGNDERPALKIGKMGHYYLANAASFVLAAGEIIFEDNKISQINDLSGAYHINFSNLERIDQLEHLASIKLLFAEVGLPIKYYYLFQSKDAPLRQFAKVAAETEFDAVKNAQESVKEFIKMGFSPS